ncbi:MAG: DUF5752 family protein [Anaerolineales bacterium]|jgi:hypothetical protein
MSKTKTDIKPFAVTDCAMLSIATGVTAQNLRELRDRLGDVPESSIYYHFWGMRLRPRFEEPIYNNDFAHWAQEGLHDRRLAERLGVIDPPSFNDLSELRLELIDVIEERLEESELVPWAKPDEGFRFIRSILVVFDTGVRITRPEDLRQLLPALSHSSLYYHFIDARRRSPEGEDDFRSWLGGFGDRYADLRDEIATIDPYFTSLSELGGLLFNCFERAGVGGEA